jgi:hypothetical protein
MERLTSSMPLRQRGYESAESAKSAQSALNATNLLPKTTERRSG